LVLGSRFCPGDKAQAMFVQRRTTIGSYVSRCWVDSWFSP
jgi:hypothetical protein